VNEAQAARLRAQIVRLRVEDDYVVVEDRDDRLEVVLGMNRGRPKQVVIDGEGKVIVAQNV
jgi:hypothetical protein